MNVVKLTGGLGNQLFQYAFGRSMINNGIEVSFDIADYKPPVILKRMPRALKEKLLNKTSRKRGQKPTIRYYMLDKFTLYPFVISEVIKERPIISDTTFNIEFIKMDNKNFYGFWHYLEYFKNIISILRFEIWVKEELHTQEYLELRKEIENCDSTSLHVRREDFKYGMGCLSVDYYKKALKIINNNIYVFSDDINWCKETFTKKDFDYNFKFIHINDHLDFELMKLCKNNIIANSTYSWWAALLNGNPDKIIVTPNIRHHAMRNNYFINWIKIEI